MTKKEIEKIERLKTLLSLQAESYEDKQQLLIAKKVIELYHDLKKDDTPFEVFDDKYGNTYIVKGKADLYPCVVAHLDQVHDVKEVYQIHQDEDIIFAVAKTKSGDYKQVGTGSDDLAGVWLCLELLLSQPILKVVFFLDEEVGCLGSEKSDTEFFKDCTFILQGDRRSDTNDFITKSNGVNISSEEFQKAVTPILEKFNYSLNKGIATDVGQLVINGVGCCTANISCGYFDEHTDEEYSLASLSLTCLYLMESIIKEMATKRWPWEKQTPPKKEAFESIKKASTYIEMLFEEMPLPTLSDFSDKVYYKYKRIWTDWAEKFFLDNFGESRFILNVPSPYSPLYTNDMWKFMNDLNKWVLTNDKKLTDMVIDLKTSKAQTFQQFLNAPKELHDDLDDDRECPVCRAWGSHGNYMTKIQGGQLRCESCGTEINSELIIN